VSHLGETEHKTVLLKNEVNALSNKGYFYSHFEKKEFSNISKINEMVRKIIQSIRKPLF